MAVFNKCLTQQQQHQLICYNFWSTKIKGCTQCCPFSPETPRHPDLQRAQPHQDLLSFTGRLIGDVTTKRHRLISCYLKPQAAFSGKKKARNSPFLQHHPTGQNNPHYSRTGSIR